MTRADQEFVHLHVHTDYSLLDGACHIDRLMQRAKALGMGALSITDHGNLFGLTDFYTRAREHGIKPILGCEIYLVIDHAHTTKPERSANKYYHMGLVARNFTGYRHLTKLVSEAHTKGFYYKPRLDIECVSQLSEGLIGFTGCLQGVVPQMLLQDDYVRARSWVGRFVEIFGSDHFFVELQDHTLPEQRRINPDLLKLAADFGLRVVCTNDVHYVEQSDSTCHDALLCIQTGTKISDEKRLRFANDQFYLKSRPEMEAIFGERPDAISNTLAVAEMCEVELPFNQNHYPVFQLPNDAGSRCATNEEYLKELSINGLHRRYGIDYFQPEEAADPDYAGQLINRVNYELRTIQETGFVDYFLIVQDFTNWALDHGIPVGPGRGSGAGSLIAYLTNITGIDPIRFKLLFERMLNPERVSPPDFDIDFCMRRRSEVVEYVRQKYGKDCVANIITFGRFGAKMVVRDIARVLDLSYAEGDRLAKMVPDELNTTLDIALERSHELRLEVDENPNANKIIEHGKIIEGMVRNTGTHAAGVIIADRPLDEYIPLTLQDGVLTTQYPKGPVEDLGLLKMDFLGLKTLTVISDAEENVRLTVDPDFSVENIPLDDEKTFKLFNDARTVGVFQMESQGMQNLCRQFSISKIDEISDLIALYRPGPMDSIPDYIRGKRDPSTIQYLHPLLKEICAETYGVIVCQEQVMEAAKVIAGYTLGGADILRQAIGKKKPEEMEKQREVFVCGAKANQGIERSKALEIFAILEKFSGYGFNRSHSAAYALLTYQTAYLKTKYPVQFMAATLSSELGNSDKVAHFIGECGAMGIPVSGPQINESRENFTPVLGVSSEGRSDTPDMNGNDLRGSIRFGLAAIKGVGDTAAKKIIQEREETGEFSDFQDLAVRVDSQAVNRRVAECLIKSGAFDFSAVDRGLLIEDLDHILSEAASLQRDRKRGQESFFELLEASSSGHRTHENQNDSTGKASPRATMPLGEKLQNEKELLGFYISGHPLDIYGGLDEAINTVSESTYRSLPDRTLFRLCGVVSQVSKRITRKDHRPWAIAVIGTRQANYPLNIYPDTYESAADNLQEGNIVLVSGTAFSREDDTRLSADAISVMGEFPSQLITEIRWFLQPEKGANGFLDKLRQMIELHPGSTTIEIAFRVPGNYAVVAPVGRSLTCTVTPAFYRNLRLHPAVVGVRFITKDPVVRNGRQRQPKRALADSRNVLSASRSTLRHA